jgi:hypothetical protein
VKKFPEVGTYSSNPPHLARAWRPCAYWLLGPGPGKAVKKSPSSWELYECCALAVEEVISWHLWFSSDYQILHCNVYRGQRFATCVSDKIFSDRTVQFQLFQRDSIVKMQPFIHFQFRSPKFRDLNRYSRCATQYVDVRPQAFTTPAQFCLLRTNQACEQKECGEKSLIRCSWCKLNMCFEHAIDASHFCDSYSA